HSTFTHLRLSQSTARFFPYTTLFRSAIVLDGIIQSAPVIQDAIYGGNAEITGSFSEQEARNLSSVLENPLQTPVSIEEERSVSRSEEHTSELQSHLNIVCRLLLEKKT